jgi:hypothetical protein
MPYERNNQDPANAMPVWVINGADGVPPGAVDLGYVQMATLTSAIELQNVPDGAQYALVQPEAGNVRWRGDGTAPTASAGQPLYATAQRMFTIPETLTDLKFINMTGSTSKLNVTYYGSV